MSFLKKSSQKWELSEKARKNELFISEALKFAKMGAI